MPKVRTVVGTTLSKNVHLASRLRLDIFHWLLGLPLLPLCVNEQKTRGSIAVLIVFEMWLGKCRRPIRIHKHV